MSQCDDKWSCLDQLTTDSEGFTPSHTLITCDVCSKPVTYPFYSVVNRDNSIDFCNTCYINKPLHIIIRKSPIVVMHAYCFICEKNIHSTVPFRVKLNSTSWIHICDLCVQIINLSFAIKQTCEKIIQPRALIQRDRFELCLQLYSIERVIQPEISKFLTKERIEQWVALIEDICIIPRHFGSIKQWCIFTPELILPPLEEHDIQIYLLIDCSKETSGRVAALLHNNVCCAYVYILFQTFSEYKKYLDTWTKYQAAITITDYNKLIRSINKLLIGKRYRKLIEKYIGLFISK